MFFVAHKKRKTYMYKINEADKKEQLTFILYISMQSMNLNCVYS